VRLGVVPGAHLISVSGRKEWSHAHNTCLCAETSGQRWLIAGFEQADWVKNLRAGRMVPADT